MSPETARNYIENIRECCGDDERTAMKNPTPVLKDDTIYLGDNGMSMCGKHCGQSARYTGRDISGQPVLEITPEIAAEAKRDMGHTITCEVCGRVAG